ncbi:hypothetical protein EBZ37_13345, partial [bacterium]|nr:hypothetical protein [bacterium]
EGFHHPAIEGEADLGSELSDLGLLLRLAIGMLGLHGVDFGLDRLDHRKFFLARASPDDINAGLEALDRNRLGDILFEPFNLGGFFSAHRLRMSGEGGGDEGKAKEGQYETVQHGSGSLLARGFTERKFVHEGASL